jgi:hypothetical protein
VNLSSEVGDDGGNPMVSFRACAAVPSEGHAGVCGAEQLEHPGGEFPGFAFAHQVTRNRAGPACTPPTAVETTDSRWPSLEQCVWRRLIERSREVSTATFTLLKKSGIEDTWPRKRTYSPSPSFAAAPGNARETRTLPRRGRARGCRSRIFADTSARIEPFSGAASPRG